jgi:hypothetical protein
MSGHTPGPWRVTDDAPTIIQCDYRSIGSSGGALIASAMGNDSSGFYVSESESLANARLIAAAPELLEALKAVLPYVVSETLEHCDGNKCREQWCIGCSGEDEATAAVDKARAASFNAYAAIAKATGATP